MQNFKKVITYFLLILFSISLIPNNVFASNLENNTNSEYEDIEYFDDGTLILSEKEVKILNTIEHIPDEVIANGSNSINNYFKEKGVTEIKVINKIRKKRGIVGCISAIGIATVVNFTPVKIAKLKGVLKAVGGTAKFVRRTVGLYNKFKATKTKFLAAKTAIFTAANNISGREVLLELFSLGSVYSECFE